MGDLIPNKPKLAFLAFRFFFLRGDNSFGPCGVAFGTLNG
jgi:hypothetical protein